MRSLRSLRSFRATWCTLPLLAATLACSDRVDPEGPGVRVDVAAYSLAGATDVCYGLYVENGQGELVAYVSHVCASQYGNRAGGDISYVIPCDARDYTDDNITNALNTVTLVLEGVMVADGNTTTWLDETQYQNPCGWPDPAQTPLAFDPEGNVSLPLDTGSPPYSGPGAGPAVNWDGFQCQKIVDCKENADAEVTFDLTVIRDADQGFFDVAVNFEDIFCSAKVDCEYDDNETIRLVHDPDSGERVPTVVFAFACTDGDPPGSADDNATTHLYLDDLLIDCGDSNASVPVWAGPGNVYDDNQTIWYDDNGTLQSDANITLPAQLVQAMVFEGRERITNSLLPADKSYWSVALGLNESWWAGNSSTCTLRTRATASKGPLTGGATPAGVSYPVIDVDVQLNSGTQMVCTQHPINGSGAHEGVATTYTGFFAPAVFENVGAPISGGGLTTDRTGATSSGDGGDGGAGGGGGGGGDDGGVGSGASCDPICAVGESCVDLGSGLACESGYVLVTRTDNSTYHFKRTEVTRGEWKRVFPQYDTLGLDTVPMTSITMYAAAIYMRELSILEGLTPCYPTAPALCTGEAWNGSLDCSGIPDNPANYELSSTSCTGYHFPNASDWEHAARAGFIDDQPTPIGDYAWYDGNAMGYQPVATRLPNAWGIFDALGNVWEPTRPTNNWTFFIAGGSFSGSGGYAVFPTGYYAVPPTQAAHDLGLRPMRNGP